MPASPMLGAAKPKGKAASVRFFGRSVLLDVAHILFKFAPKLRARMHHCLNTFPASFFKLSTHSRGSEIRDGNTCLTIIPATARERQIAPQQERSPAQRPE
eukprot:6179950-Prymnesium_polylepis.2